MIRWNDNTITYYTGYNDGVQILRRKHPIDNPVRMVFITYG